MRNSKVNLGWLLVFLLSIIPVVIWFKIPKIDPPFGDSQATLASLGELFGLVGIILFSINLLLATRLPFIEVLFNGLNDAYNKHSFIGQLALMLLLFHPLLLLSRYADSWREASNFLFIGDSPARNFGIMALWLMVGLIILALYLRPKYDLWKITHKLFGFAFFLGSLHAYLIPGYVISNLFLKSYILAFSVLGTLTFLYRSILGKYLVKKYKYIVTNIQHLNPKTVKITLKPKSYKMDFLAGQFVFISFQQDGLTESHPFSISSSPHTELLSITVKSLGDFTEKLTNELKIGTSAKIEGPYGKFSYTNTSTKNQIWIAGGIGVTPFISFAKDLFKKQLQDLNITLFYCTQNEEDAVYLNLLKKIENSVNSLRVIPFYSDIKGYINTEYIKNKTTNLSDSEIFICAPPKMIKSLRDGLIKNGIKETQIYSEEFNL